MKRTPGKSSTTAGMLAAIGLAMIAVIHGASVSAAPPTRVAATETAAAPVDINRAGEAELTTIPGIGPATAKRIVEFRSSNGPFASVDDLLKVRGIGEKSLEKLRPHVTIGRSK